MDAYQNTIAGRIEFHGVGLHSGTRSDAVLLPAPPDTGIVIRRTDLGQDIPAIVENVVETSYATVLGAGRARVSTVEHFLAALYGMGIDNAIIETAGGELPILDGSALPIAGAIASCGTEAQPVRKAYLHVPRVERVRRNGSLAVVSPSDDLDLFMIVDFPGTAIGEQRYRISLTPERFLKEIAPARTFVLLEQIEALQAAGLARGGSLDNAIVVEGQTVHNTEGLRFPDEFVRHKLLDFIGDIALCGRPVLGGFRAVRPGHTVNRQVTEYLSSLSAAVFQAAAGDEEMRARL